MADINLPPNVKQDPNTGLYLITNAQGKTVRVNADTQEQLNQYVNSVNTGVPATITVTDPNTGNPRTRTFDSNAIVAQQDSVANQQQLLTDGKRKAGVLGNRDGSYQDIRTGQTISKEEAEAKIKSAGLPPETLAAVTPKDSPAYAAAQQSINQTATEPSNIPPANALQPEQSSGGNSTGEAVTQSVPAPAAAPTVAATDAPQQVPVQDSLAPGEELVATDAPAPQQIETFNEGQSTITTVTEVPEPVDPQTFEAGGGGGNQGTITRVTYQPEDVPPTEDPAAGATEAAATGGNQSTINIGTDENRGGNLEAATKQRAQEQAALQARFNQPANGDWRVRLRLAPNSNYLYNDASPGILAPLKASDGVIFPYTPSISTSYNANYDVAELTHSNYRGQFYKNSNVGDISINGIFTAQDTAEAEYMLAVVHFFRSVTKMFYGQDAQRGAPPPLVYLFGLGQYQFNNHPCVVKSFTYNLPTDVDYIRTQPNNYGVNLLNRRAKTTTAPANTIGSVVGRLSHAVDLLGNILKPGALSGLGASRAGQPGVAQQAVYNTSNATYVPTKIEIQLSLLPIQTRNQVSQQFSLKGFASGDLLRGGFW